MLKRDDMLGKRIKQLLYLSLILIGYHLSILYAGPKPQAISYSTGVGSPITTSSTDLMTKGSWGVSQRIEYYPSRPFSDEKLLADPLSESQAGAYFNYLMINYGLGNNLSIGSSLPYNHTTNLRSATIDEEFNSFDVANLGNISGISDASFYALGRLFDQDKYPVSMAVLAGINTPTGKTNAKTRNGDLFATSDQPGNGAWVPFGGLIFSKKWDSLMMSTNLNYTQTTQGAQKTTLGSNFDYNIAAVYEVYTNKKTHFNIDGIIELNASSAAKDEVEGIKDNNSGGSNLFLSPGVRVNANEHVSFYLSLTLPLIEQYNGSQVKTKYGAISGIDISF